MKELFKYAFFFILAVFTASIFTGCGSQAPSNTASDSETVNTEVPKKPSEYPPVSSAVANAEIRQLDGTVFKVADKRGKVLLLNMWATWCGPCRQEMPELVKLQDAYRDQGFEVIGLNTDDEPAAKISEFAASMKLNYNLVWADTKLQTELVKISKFGGIPQSFLVDREGNLRGVFTSASPQTIAKMKEIVPKVIAGEDSPVADQSTVSSVTAQPAVGENSVEINDNKKATASKSSK